MGNSRSKRARQAAANAIEEKGEGDIHYSISITITQGRNLRAMDVNGKSDPYVVLTTPCKQSVQTKVINKNLNPVWNERLHLITLSKPKTITLDVYDWDRLSKDDFIGRKTIKITKKLLDYSGPPKYKWVTLMDGDEKTGEIEIAVQADEYSYNAQREVSSEITHFIRIEILEGKDLARKDLVKNDSVCRLSCGTQIFTTKVVKGKNPLWNQTSWLFVDEVRNANYKILIEAYDKDKFTADDTIGGAYLNIKDLLKASGKKATQKWVKLNRFVAETDNTLNAVNTDELKQDGKNVGSILIKYEVFEASKVEKDIFSEMYKVVVSEKDRENQNRMFTYEQVFQLLWLLDPKLSQKQVEYFAKSTDANKDGMIDESEIIRVLHAREFYHSGVGRLLLQFWYQDGNIRSNFIQSMMVPQRRSRKAQQLIIKDRETGLQVKEKIPGYIRLSMKLMFSNVIGRSVTGHTVGLLQNLSEAQGRTYETKESVQSIPAFIKLHNLNKAEFDKEIGEYKTFNEFFSRGMKNIDQLRPLAEPNNDSVAVCPADCRMVVFPTLVEATDLWIKGKNFTLESLFGSAKKYSKTFKGASLCIARLAPQDYHRWHYPVTGKLGKSYRNEGALYTVNPIAINENINVYCENTRTVVLIDTKEFGLVALIAIGATMVGTMEIQGQPGDKVKKGQEHGKFLFGGSTVLVLFQSGSIEFDKDLLNNSLMRSKDDNVVETLVRVRSSLGRALKPGKRLKDIK